MRENFFRIGVGINDDWIFFLICRNIPISKRLNVVQGWQKGFTVQWRLS